MNSGRVVNLKYTFQENWWGTVFF